MRSFFLLLVLLCSVTAYAQDQLFKKDNTRLEVKVLEITPTEIKYKLFSNPDGPTYTILKSEAALVIYKNGQHEAFQDAPPQQPQVVPVYGAVPAMPVIVDTEYVHEHTRREKEYEKLIKRKNVIFINSAEFLNSGIGFSYFREFFQNRIDLHVPVALSFDVPVISSEYITLNAKPEGISSVTITTKNIDAGLGIYVNTSGKRAITHFIGPMARFVQYSGICNVPVTYNNSVYPYYGYTTNTAYHCVYQQFQVLLNNGFLYRFTPHFNMMINAAFGVATVRNFTTNNPANHDYYFSYNTLTAAFQLGFSFGYRF